MIAEDVWEANTEARVIFETDLKRRPKETSRAKGRLPDGSLVTLVGKQRGDYQLVEVVLEDGSALEGWVNMNALEPVDKLGGGPNRTRPREEVAEKIVVPSDEGLLLKRDPSFFFGVNLGGNFGTIQPAQAPQEFTYIGLGFLGGAYGGFYVENNIPLRFEVNYLQFTGSDAGDIDPLTNDSRVLAYGFVELAVVPSLLVGDFEIFGGLGYAIGISIASDPVGFAPNPGEEVQVPADLSSLSGHLGAGYSFALTREIQMAVKGRYTIHFKTSPILFMGFAGLVSFQLQG